MAAAATPEITVTKLEVVPNQCPIEKELNLELEFKTPVDLNDAFWEIRVCNPSECFASDVGENFESNSSIPLLRYHKLMLGFVASCGLRGFVCVWVVYSLLKWLNTYSVLFSTSLTHHSSGTSLISNRQAFPIIRIICCTMRLDAFAILLLLDKLFHSSAKQQPPSMQLARTR